MKRQFSHAADLRAIVHSPRIFAECRFLSIAQEIGAADMMMVAHFRTAQAGEIAFGLIGASLAITVGFLMVDAAHFVF